jgi:hypothetical protein
MKKRPQLPIELPPVHPRYDRTQWLLRDIVSVHVEVTNNDTWFSCNLTRVPSVGEVLLYGPHEYQVLRVFHSEVDNDGRTIAGNHAYIDAELLPEEPCVPGQRRKKRRPADH